MSLSSCGCISNPEGMAQIVQGRKAAFLESCRIQDLETAGFCADKNSKSRGAD
ncbi:UNVERIFIED_CONTAM: hypothetical protein FKN15_053088 [Acipenser sinensis]